jgi:hypothetical protein
MKQRFYVKNNLSQRSDIKDVIQWPIRYSFGLRRPAIVNTEKSQGCLTTFAAVCNYISTRDLVREHIASKVWPLTAKWEMLKNDDADINAEKIV